MERVSVTGSGGQADARSLECRISADGRYVAFSTMADLLPADTNRQADIYVRDLVTNTLELVSVSAAAVAGNASSKSPSVSGDGRWVAFVTTAADIAPGATLPAVVLRDRCVSSGVPVPGCTPATEVVSLTYNGGQPSGGTTLGPPAVSADGRFAAFGSDHTNLVADDTNTCIAFSTPGTCPDVFVRDRCLSNGVAVPGCSPTTERVSITPDGTQSDLPASEFTAPAISDDGSIVASMVFAPIPPAGLLPELYVRDLPHGMTELVRRMPPGGTGLASSAGRVAISGDGRFVTFENPDLIFGAGRIFPADLIFVHDRFTGAEDTVSLGSDGSRPNNASVVPSVSGDGRLFLFASLASNLVPRDTNGVQDVFVHDRPTGTTERVSVAIDGSQPNGASFSGAISADGHWVCFVSSASNLLGLGVDTNGVDDVFVRKLD